MRLGKQPVDVLVRDVEAAERVVRVLVRRAPSSDGGAHAFLDDGAASAEVRERCGLAGLGREPGDALPGVGGAGRQAGAFVRGSRRSAAPPGSSSSTPRPQFVEYGRPGGAHPARVERHVDHEVERRLQLAAERRPDVGEGALLRRRQRDRHGQAVGLAGERAGEHVLGQPLVGEEAREQRRQHTVLVLGALRPDRDEVRERVPARRRPPLDDLALAVAQLLEGDLAPLDVLADVVEVDVDRGRVATCGPFTGGRLEGELEPGAVDGVAEHEPAQGLVDLVDHRTSLLPRHARGQRRPERAQGSLGCPKGHAAAAGLAAADLSGMTIARWRRHQGGLVAGERRQTVETTPGGEASRWARAGPVGHTSASRCCAEARCCSRCSRAQAIGPSPRLVQRWRDGSKDVGLPQGTPAPVQRQGPEEEEEPVQGRFEPVQLQGPEEEEEPVQGRFEPVQLQGPEEEEEPVQGRFEPAQLQGPEEEEEPLQGRSRAGPAGARIGAAPERHGPARRSQVRCRVALGHLPGRRRCPLQLSGAGADQRPGLHAGQRDPRCARPGTASSP